ncbi:hypothetical protein Pfo_007310 [Paulownia fortunei]|nr:hypothetical protein Pfo_007310 [Paulownia fortunei]
MSKNDDTVTLKNPKQDGFREREEEEEDSDQPKLVMKNSDEVYCQTPTSEEHKIPESIDSCPPPPPRKKRKKVFVYEKKLPKSDMFENTAAGGEELELFFRSFAQDSRVPPEPGLRTAAKKRRTGQ